jgi:hypothetical protein
VAHSKAKLKSNGDRASPCFEAILKRKCIRQMFSYTDFATGVI